MTWYIIAAIAAVVLLLVLLIAGTRIFFNYAILSENYQKGKKQRSAWDEDEERPDEVIFNPNCIPYRDKLIEKRKWVKSHELKDYEVTSFDGLKLRAKFMACDKGYMRGIVLMMHGFHSNPLHDFNLAIEVFNERGFGCMLPYQRAHGESEGKYLYYGTRERYDVISWCKLIEKEYPGLPVILDGISMGASTVMMASGLDELPSNVKGIVADCGYTSPYEIFVAVMKRRFNMSPFPLLYTTDLYSKIRARFFMRSASTLDALKKNKLPIVILHGQEDSFVPHSMSVENHAVAKEHSWAELVSVPGAEHGMSFLIDSEKYLKGVDDMLAECMPKQ